MPLELEPITKSHPELRAWMQDHYSQPKGFVGRQLIYRVKVDDVAYGAIAAGSATRFLPGRDTVLPLNSIVNNTFFHIEKKEGRYPCHNFAAKVVAAWRAIVERDWFMRYRDRVLAWETLVELPRTGELYVRDGWREVGLTKGFTCKRGSGKGTDSWSGKRIWDTKNLRPKRVFTRGII